MENLLEVLIPLIFAAVYFFGNMLSGNKDEEPSQPKRSPKPDYEPTQADRDYAERQQRIQEEIRRKIEERRQAASERQPSATSTQTPPPITGDLRRRRRAVRERLKERKDKHKDTHESVHETMPQVASTREAEPVDDEAFSWDISVNVYEQNMEAQLQQIEETKRRAEALRRKAKSLSKQGKPKTQTASYSGGSFLSGPVRDTLNNPAAARAAFVYSEVLGQPVGLRKGENLPGLS